MTKNIITYGERIGLIEKETGSGVKTIFLYKYCGALFFIEALDGEFDNPKRNITINDIYINLNDNIIKRIGGKNLIVEIDFKMEFVYKILKTKIKAIDGIDGLVEFIFKSDERKRSNFFNQIK